MAMTLEQFGLKIKEKYPQYQNVDNIELAKKVIEKHPVYTSQVDQGELTQATKAPATTPAAPPPEKKSLGRKVFDFFTGSEQTLKKALTAGMSVPYLSNLQEQSNVQYASLQKGLLDTIKDPNVPVERKKELIQYFQNSAPDIFASNPDLQLTAKQIYGAGLGTALDIASFGTYGKAAAGAKTLRPMIGSELGMKAARKLGVSYTVPATKEALLNVMKLHAVDQLGAASPELAKAAAKISLKGVSSPSQLASKLYEVAGPSATPEVMSAISRWAETAAMEFSSIAAPAVSSVAKTVLKGAATGAGRGAAFGAGYGAAGAMQEDSTLKQTAESALTGGITGGLLGGVISGISSYTAATAPQKAEKLRQKAIIQYEKGLQASTQKTKEQADKIVPKLLDSGVWGTKKQLLEKAQKGIALSDKEYQALGELQGVVSSPEIMSTIDKMQNELKVNGNVVSVNLPKFKALENIKKDILSIQTLNDVTQNPEIQQEALRNLASIYGHEIYGTSKAQKTIMDMKTLSQVKTVDASIRKILGEKNPTYANINKIYTLNTTLKDVVSKAIEKDAKAPVIGLNSILTALGGGALGGTHGLIGASVGAVGMSALLQILKSTWWNTFSAVQKNNLAQKLLLKSADELPKYLGLLAGQGAKAANMLLNEK